MILKKPYGLLIKHFKLIHLILTILTVFIAIQTKTIVNFFSDYVANNYSATIFDNMVSTYINALVYIALFLSLLMLLAVYILLKYKQKPTKIYFVTIIYYIILLLMVLVASHLIGSLSEGLWATASARQYRDFAQLIYWPQLFFIIVLAIRALGFNVKQFNFKNDLKELELTDKDSELIEVNFGFDTSKTKRTLRRLIREFSYYFKENKFIVICIIFLGVVFLGYFGYKGYEKIHYTYKQGSNFNYDGFALNIEDSIITNLSYEGKIVNENKYYLLIKVKLTNNSREEKELDYSNFKVYIGNKYYNPSLESGNYFIDYAKPYNGEKIKSKETKTVLLNYSIDKSEIKEDFSITIYTGQSTKKEEYTAKTITVELSPVIIDNISIVKNAELNDEIVFDGTYLNNTTLKVKDYVIGKKYNYEYKSCYNGDCTTYKDFVAADYSLQNKQTLLILDCDFEIDKTSAYYESNKAFSSFVSNFVKVRYELNGGSRIVNIKNVTPTNMKDKVALQVSSDIEAAEKVELYITIRNKSYVISLKS